MAYRSYRARGPSFSAAVAIALLLCLLFPALAPAQDDAASLAGEADRLTYEILELKARLRTAQGNRDAMLVEMASLDAAIATSEAEIAGLNDELEACQQAYDLSLRALYKRGTVSEMEVILGAREIEELWEDNAFLDRMVQSDTDTLERLKSKINEIELKRRALRDQHAQRQRMAEALDTQGLEARIGELQARLSEVDASLRSLGGGGSARNAPTEPAQGWTVPAPGELLERVPTMPPLSDFERTGMVFSGYTTCYGEEFDGSATASGVTFHMYDYTCAHRTFPFGTWLLVTFNGRQTIVQVNDRGPFVPGRVLDLSYGSAQSIGLDGVQWTEFEILVPRGG